MAMTNGYKHTFTELYQMQSLSLNSKINMTIQRIQAWIDTYGEDCVYVSFSGGKDSTVLLDIVRNKMGYKNILAVFCDTGLEYPEIREFVKSYDNVVWLKPELTFRQVIEKYGYPLISKEVANCVRGARKYLTNLKVKEHALEQNRTEQNRTEQNDSVCLLHGGYVGHRTEAKQRESRIYCDSKGEHP